VWIDIVARLVSDRKLFADVVFAIGHTDLPERVERQGTIVPSYRLRTGRRVAKVADSRTWVRTRVAFVELVKVVRCSLFYLLWKQYDGDVILAVQNARIL
jgi:hypothetical protein